MARYNAWANKRLYAACDPLTDAEYFAQRQAFFGSIHRTLNHILVGDRIWIERLTSQPPSGLQLDRIAYEHLKSWSMPGQRKTPGFSPLPNNGAALG